ncbi:MAG: aminoacetone oxidase family FAD-binding enzyme [Ruminococcus sp.]|nr:aminoacetone oxidase family FAD-binding enzyme [Ruminococcus sp.]
MITDIAVIGGGASGLTAAISAKETCGNASVTVIERLPRVGKKIIASGNGKCNLSNLVIKKENYHGTVNAVDIIRRMPDYKQFFTDYLGVLCVNGSEGREGGIYPRSNSSATVLNALRLRLDMLGVSIICDCGIIDIKPEKNRFRLIHKNEEIICRRLIVATGGYASPSFGTDGSVMRILRDIGYRTEKICPAVAPLRVNPESLKGLKGVRVKGCVSAVSGGKILRTEYGEMQFNENNISGICVFNLAYLFGKYEGRLRLRADFLPDIDISELSDYLFRIRKQHGNMPLEELLTGIFVKNLAVYITRKSVQRPLDNKISSLKNSEILCVVNNIKSLEFEVSGCASWQNAQTTMGGIHSSCVDENLQSRIHKGMYFCGEILDTAGDCGGYNLQWAWSSGMLAGGSCGKSLRGVKK